MIASAQPKWFVALLLALMLLLLASFLPIGYGPDVDSWLVAYAARTLWEEGRYQVSRLPGYPLHEIVSAPLVGLGGPLLSNAGTLAIALATVGVWWGLSVRYARRAVLTTVALAFAPLLCSQAAATIDYPWSLFFIVLALRWVLDGKPLPAGIAAGLAAGFRPPNLVAVLPLLLVLHLQHANRKALSLFVLTACGTALVTFLPMILLYGPAGWVESTYAEMGDVHPSLQNRVLFFLYRSAYAVGPLALAALLWVLARQRAALHSALSHRDPVLVPAVAGVIVFLLLFLMLPLERAYLLPALPFLLLLVDRIASPSQHGVFTVCLLSLCLVNPDIAGHGMDSPRLQPALRPGRLAESWRERSEFLRVREEIASMPLPARSMLMTGGGITFWFENPLVRTDTSGRWQGFRARVVCSVKEPERFFVASLRPEEINQVRREGLSVFCLANARRVVEPLLGTTLEQAGVTVVQ